MGGSINRRLLTESAARALIFQIRTYGEVFPFFKQAECLPYLGSMPVLVLLDVFLFEPELFGCVQNEHLHADVRRYGALR